MGHAFLELFDSSHDGLPALRVFSGIPFGPVSLAFLAAPSQAFANSPGHVADGLGVIVTTLLVQHLSGEPQDLGLFTRFRVVLADATGLIVAAAFQGDLAGPDGALEQLGGVAALGLQQGAHRDAEQLQLMHGDGAFIAPRMGSALLLTCVFACQFGDDRGPLGVSGVLKQFGRDAQQLGEFSTVGCRLPNSAGLVVASPRDGEFAGVHGPLDEIGGIVAIGLHKGLDGISHDLDATPDDVALRVPVTSALAGLDLAADLGGDFLEASGLVVPADLR